MYNTFTGLDNEVEFTHTHKYTKKTLPTKLKQHLWTGILRDKIVGTVFFNQIYRLPTDDIFVDLLEDIIEPLIFQALKDQIDGDQHLDEKRLHLHYMKIHPITPNQKVT